MEESYLEEAIAGLGSGSAICLLGAGFSLGAKDGFGQDVPTTTMLEQEICNMIGISKEEGGSLSDLADYCMRNKEFGPKLRELLIKRLTICQPSETQKKMLKVPWRSIFTTNFDDIVERALPDDQISTHTPLTLGKKINTGKTPVFYLHGRALDILENESDPSIVVSETNYLDLKEKNRDLYGVFINEVVCAKWIFFIGYSLRDMEIAQRLFNIDESIRSRSIVISGPTESPIAVSRLEKFGEVHSIGTEGFALRLPASFPSFDASDTVVNPVYVNQVIRKPPKDEVTRSDIDRLILSGEFDPECYAAQLGSESQDQHYCVNRGEKIDAVFDGIKNGIRRVIVTSDVGNGKSTFLRQLEYAALKKNYEVFRIDTNLPEMFAELERLTSRPTRQMFILDDLQRHSKAAQFIGARLNGLGVMICSARDSFDDVDFQRLETVLGGSAREIDLNRLNSDELTQWERIFERYGYWEQRIEWSEANRFDFLQNKCAAENRSIVLSIFKTSRIATQVSEIVDFFLKQKPEHTRAFVAILISALCQKHVEWERVVQWININQTQLKRDIQDQRIFDFMKDRRDWHQFTSSQLADYIFKNHGFSDEVVVEVYTKIVRETAFSANDFRSGFDSAENIKELMKYWFLRLLFGDGESARKSIEAVYDRLSGIQRIRNNPQFWLQYAMSNLENGNLPNAESYIETALGKSKARFNDDYPTQIIDQRARVLLMKNARKRGEPNTNEIETVLTDLKRLMKERGADIVYPIRASKFILEFVDEKIDHLSADTRGRFLALLKDMYSHFGARKLERTRRGESEKLKEYVRKAIMVLNNG